ncbi:MAG: sulfotransferase domain-containing protein [Gilvibacter sp.]
MNKSINFYVIGAQKAGTSWLYQRLKELPEFELPPVKQLHYFDRDKKYNSPNKLSKTKLSARLFDIKWLAKAKLITFMTFLKGKFKMSRWYFKWFFGNFNDTWYVSLFSTFKGLTGEITPSYSMLEEEDIAHMAQLAPDAKILFILRNPTDRAWSHYRYDTRKIANFDISKVTADQIMEFINSEEQELRNNYSETIRRYCKYFKKEQILIGFYDAISQQPIAFLEDVVSFFGGDASKVEALCKVEARVNVSKKIDMPIAVKEALDKKYTQSIQQLNNDLGSYTSHWLSQLGTDQTVAPPSGLAPTVRL